MKTCLLWFRNNLRIHDNSPVSFAYEQYDRVIPIYLYPKSIATGDWGDAHFGDSRKAFLDQSLLDLQVTLESYGSRLYVLRNLEALDLIQIALDHNAEAIIGGAEMAYNETVDQTNIKAAGKSSGMFVKFLEERTLFKEHQLPFLVQELPEVFTKFRKLVEKYSTVLPTVQTATFSSLDSLTVKLTYEKIKPTALTKDHRSAVPFEGGETQGLKEVTYYFKQTRLILKYKETRNELLGRDYSSKFSPFLALGCISVRQVYEDLKQFEQEIESNESTYWLFFELLWREYFQWVALKHGKNLFLPLGLRPDKPVTKGFNQKAFERWKNGTTPDEFVNSNMKELAETGFMSNRGRQNVASYLIHDMGIEWRAGAAHFENHLIDYDPASNYGNWLYLAGRGNDPRPFRKFDTIFQANRYDPDKKFISTW